MKIEQDGINVHIEDVAAILELDGIFKNNAPFIQETRLLAIEHTKRHEEEIREQFADETRVPQFRRGLLEGLRTNLELAYNDDLSKYLMFSSMESRTDDGYTVHRFAIYSLIHAPALARYYQERTVGFTVAIDDASTRMRELPIGSPRYKMDFNVRHGAIEARDTYQFYFDQLRALGSTSHVPTEN